MTHVQMVHGPTALPSGMGGAFGGGLVRMRVSVGCKQVGEEGDSRVKVILGVWNEG